MRRGSPQQANKNQDNRGASEYVPGLDVGKPTSNHKGTGDRNGRPRDPAHPKRGGCQIARECDKEADGDGVAIRTEDRHKSRAEESDGYRPVAPER